jgi:hypothetical protein
MLPVPFLPLHYTPTLVAVQMDENQSNRCEEAPTGFSTVRDYRKNRAAFLCGALSGALAATLLVRLIATVEA